jgi:F420H(2)-dependent quinone reductase
MRATITLEAVGRRSGRPREVVLYAFPDGDRLVVVGSRGGSARDPVWADNLRAQPRATIRRDDDQITVVAREVAGDERARLWDMVCEAYPTYAHFQRKTKRLIPLFVLEPVGAADSVTSS